MNSRTRAIIGIIVIIEVLFAIAFFGVLSNHTTTTRAGGGHPHSTGVRTVVTTHQTNDATVVNDPWCAKSEDSCVINYRPSGQWAIKRVIP